MMRQQVPPQKTSSVQAPFQEPPLKFRASKYTAVVKEVFDVAPEPPATYLIRFTIDGQPGVFYFQPGQFMSVFAEKEGKSISRPYSIASSPEEKERLELVIKVVEGGFMSNYLHTVAPGTKLKVIGPLGRFILLEPPERDILFVATGTGVAPFISMLGHIFAMGYDVDVHLAFGVRYVHDLVYQDLLGKWAQRHPNFHLYTTVSRPGDSGWKGRVGYVEKVIDEEIKDYANTDVYICGLHDMVEQVKTQCEALKFHLVRFEKWD
jgi:NAD(P)H-flavin reductase